jgi:hypothetical protein
MPGRSVPRRRAACRRGRGVRAVLCVTAASFLVAGISPGSTAATPRLQLAAQDDPVFVAPESKAQRERTFARMAQLGMTWLRINVLWANVNGRQAARRTAPARPSYAWRALDEAIHAARRHGFRVQLALMGPAPAWATGDHRVGVYMPSPEAFGRFAAAAARHFGRTVMRYSIWNEPNLGLFLSPQVDGGTLVSPGIYRQLFRAGSAAIRAANPRAQVLLGETCPCGGTDVFLKAMACGTTSPRGRRPCAPLRADGFAHHPYQAPEAPEQPVKADQLGIGSLGYLTEILDDLHRVGALVTPGGRPVPIYLTEFGYQAAGPVALPAETRTRFLPRAFEIAYRNRRVRQILQYQMVSHASPAWNTAILARNGQPDGVFTALRAWVDRRGLAHAAAATRLSRAPHPTGGTPAEP